MHTIRVSALLPMAILAALGVGRFTATAAHIDFALDGPFFSSSGLGDAGEVSGDPGNILGGSRAYETTNESFDGTVTTSLAMGGPLSLMDSGGAQGRYWFGYGNESSAGDLNADFVGVPNWNALAFTVDSVAGSGSLGVFINSGPDSFVFNDLTVDAPGEYLFFYDEVSDAIAGFDFTSVDGLNFEFRSTEVDSGVNISSIKRATRMRQVPEPGVGLLAISVTWIGLFIRRRKPESAS